MAATATPAAPTNAFEHEMHCITRHCHSGCHSGTAQSFVRFPVPPPSPQRLAEIADSSNLSDTMPDEIKKHLGDMERNGPTVVEQMRTDSVEELKILDAAVGKSQQVKEQAQTSFELQIRSRQDKLIADSIKVVTAGSDRLIEFGNKYPKFQPLILNAWDAVAAFFAKVFAAIRDWVVDLIKRIAKWFWDLIDWIKQAYSAVEEWTDATVKSVTSWMQFAT
ncbi:MAG: hypothetical protein GY835_09205 [bacterium]|nr:hypothetical protein [bacterium]